VTIQQRVAEIILDGLGMELRSHHSS
jgi:hypothetical protein